VPDAAPRLTTVLPKTRPASARHVENVVLIACGLAWGAALIHVQAAVDHLDEYWLYALFFALLAAAQLLWGAALYRSPGRHLLVAGAIGSLMVVALWVVSRTSGLPIGPDAGSAESLGLLDSVASADEVALAVLAALQLRPPPKGRLARGAGHLVGAASVFLILLSSLAFTGGGHAH
jgi:hypothetical protein